LQTEVDKVLRDSRNYAAIAAAQVSAFEQQLQ
jgi:hypothetical protein